MKTNKFKLLSIAVCSLVTAVWSKTQGMEYYNEGVKSYVPTYNLTDQNFIDDINNIISEGNKIKVINLADKGLITDISVNHILANIENLDLLNLDGTNVKQSIPVLKIGMPNTTI